MASNCPLKYCRIRVILSMAGLSRIRTLFLSTLIKPFGSHLFHEEIWHIHYPRFPRGALASYPRALVPQMVFRWRPRTELMFRADLAMKHFILLVYVIAH